MIKAMGQLDHGAPEPLSSFLIYIESIQGKSRRTANEYFYDLRTFYRFLKIYFGLVSEEIPFQEIPIDDVTIDLLRKVNLQILYEYMNFLNRVRNNSPRARARKAASLKSFYRYLYSKVNLVDENPTVELESVKSHSQLPKHFTLEDSIALLEAVENRNAERDYCILTLFLNCGMRLGRIG